MHIAAFLQDIAIIMIVAGIVTILFHQLKQPVVLGYIIAGMILGPHTPPFKLIQDENTIRTLAELGVIFLMFSLGLEFSIQKLLKVGPAALLAAIAEIIVMILVGYELGQFFGWHRIDSIFLGAMLAISSTTIIIKALNELGMKKKPFAQLIFGILIIEDILAIGMLALLSSMARSGTVDTLNVFMTLGKLIVFLVVSFVVGILTVPKLLSYIARFNSKELIVITVLDLCFGFCLLVFRMDYSIALGAFVMGAIIAEAREIKLIEKLIEPITTMFSAIFFVSIGLMVDPFMMITYLVPIILITIAVVIGKITMCSIGVFLAGRDARTSLRVGMGLAQIGEFSFIIAGLGISLNVTSHFLYPIIVAVSALTTLLTPYLIKIADPFSQYLSSITPSRIRSICHNYTRWLKHFKPHGPNAILMRVVKKNIFQIGINSSLVIAIFVVGAYFSHRLKYYFSINLDIQLLKTLIWGTAIILSLPFLIAIYRKLKGLSLLMAEMLIKPNESGDDNTLQRQLISQITSMLSMLGMLFLLLALSASILPPLGLLIIILVIAIVLTAVGWRWFVQFHSRLQISLMNRLDKHQKK